MTESLQTAQAAVKDSPFWSTVGVIIGKRYPSDRSLVSDMSPSAHTANA
jgi:hypothetical protein